MKKTLILLLAITVLVSCGKNNPVVNGEDPASFNASINSLKENLPTLQKEKLSEAVQLVFDYNTFSRDGNRWKKVHTILDKKTADEIFGIAEEIAHNNGIVWNRNQAPYPGGLPKPKTENKAELAVLRKESPIKEANNLDLSVDLTEEAIHIYPTFLREDGTEVRFTKAVNNILVELFSENNLVYSKKAKLETYREGNPDFGGNGLVVLLKHLRTERIKNETLKLKVRVSHPERYLISHGKVKIPISYIGYKQPPASSKNLAKDSIENKEVAVVPKKEDPEASISKLITKKFIEDIKRQDLNKAYGLTRNPKWSSYKAFTSTENGFGGFKNLKNETVKFVNKEGNQAKVSVNFTADHENGETAKYKYNYTLTKENNRWFITDSQLISKNVLETPKTQAKDSLR